MIKVDRLCVWILIFGLIMIIPSMHYFTFADELCSVLFGLLALIDSVVNGNWRRYNLLWIIAAVMTFYAMYSVTCAANNTLPNILADWIIEIKPFVPFVVMLAVRPKFTLQERALIRRICLINGAIMSVALMIGIKVTNLLVMHPAYAGTIIVVSSMLYAYCSVDSDGKLPRRDFYIVVAMLVCGLLCTKAKYYGVFVVIMYFLCLYRPGIMRGFGLKQLSITVVICSLIILVAWNKIQYYFLMGNGDTFDPNLIQSYARPVMYMTAGMILVDHFPFGTGLASFGTFPSSVNLSEVYYEYGINNIHGISPRSEDNFICDAYYPGLAQFGAIGLLLFVAFWIYAYHFLKILIRNNPKLNKYPFMIGSCMICFILIESIAATTFTQNCGMIAMCVLGIICGQAYGLEDKTQKVKRDYINNSQSSVQIIRI